MPNYVPYHVHSDLSNGVTNIDSVTKYTDYIARAQECGMDALGFSEHGSVYVWYHKKCAIEKAGMKYLHATEVYVTENTIDQDLTERVRDSYHCVLIAKNWEGVKEINRLVSGAFDRTSIHFYYVPRITMDELMNTSDNVVVTSACIGGAFAKAPPETKGKLLNWYSQHKDRCFLEIQHHLDMQQYDYNQWLVGIAQQYGIRLVAATDTHCLNEQHREGRSILQRSKNINFPNESAWDLTFKTYDELCDAFDKQGAVNREIYLQAIDNTNLIASMVEPFEVDTHSKYPHISDNPDVALREKVERAVMTHPYALKRYSKEEIMQTVDTELDAYAKTGASDFILFQSQLRDWEKTNGIECGYGRGSVSGSFVAYLLGITEMDSKRFDLNFFRFINPDRVTNADIDTDYSGEDRTKVKEFLLRDKMGMDTFQTSEIITFNTIATKGAILDVCRALEIPLADARKMSASVQVAVDENGHKTERIPEDVRKKHPEVFKYVDIITGTVVSVGTHPSGVLVTDHDIASEIGTCSISSTPYPVSELNMKELDAMMYTKLDILGLDGVGLINATCTLAGIERKTPDNTDLEDMDVWRSIRNDTTAIFQWESNSAQTFLRKFMSDTTIEKVRQKIPNFSMLKWLSFGNGLIRPACASFRDSVADGEFYDNGFKELNDFLAPEMGHVCMQETIMQFLVKFCGYTNGESDNVRRAIAKKKGTEQLLPEIEQRFIEYSSTHYDITAEECAKVIKPFLKVLLDASAYAFSWNHSDAYSAVGYICGWLREYYPYEFITSALNIWRDNDDKTRAIVEYANSKRISITSPKFGISGIKYDFSREQQTIAKGLGSVKFMSDAAIRELSELYDNQYATFSELLYDIKQKTSLNTRQIEILMKIDFFSQFGNYPTISRIYDVFTNLLKWGDVKSISKATLSSELLQIFEGSPAVSDTGANGDTIKMYRVKDAMGLAKEIESTIRSVNFADISLITRMEFSKESYGYVDVVTNKPEDRRKLIINSITPMRNGNDKPWGYRVETKSLGTGKSARVTIKAKVFDAEPVDEGNVIYVEDIWQNAKGYWEISKYRRLT